MSDCIYPQVAFVDNNDKDMQIPSHHSLFNKSVCDENITNIRRWCIQQVLNSEVHCDIKPHT